MAENRRVRMTKQLMKDALLELMETKQFEKIKVTDLCSAADVNRSTFYAYYSDIQDLLGEIEDSLLESLPGLEQKGGTGKGQFLSDLEKYFEFVKRNKRLFYILVVRRSSDSFNRRLIEAVMERYGHDTLSQSDRYTYTFCVSGVLGILKDWIAGDFPMPSREFAALVLERCTKATEA